MSGYHFRQNDQQQIQLFPDNIHFAAQLHAWFSRIADISPWYASQLDKTPWQSDPLLALQQLPITRKENYRDILQTEALQALKNQRYISDFSSGSTDKCVLKLSSLTEELAEQHVTEEVFQRCGLRPKMRFACMDIGVPEIYDFYFRAAQNLGVSDYHFVHLTQNSHHSVDILSRLQPDVLLTLPTMLARIWPILVRSKQHFKNRLQKIIFMGEVLPDNFRKEIIATLGCQVYSFYGTTETGGIASNCDQHQDLHFTPENILPSLDKAQKMDDQTWQGEVLWTTLHFHLQSVIKYHVGDRIQITTTPCSCGSSLPRMQFLQRCSDSFSLYGVKFRHQAILAAMQKIDPQLSRVSICLEDQPDSEKTQLTLFLPQSSEAFYPAFCKVMEERIFELDTLLQYQLIEYKLVFVSATELAERKIKNIMDKRRKWE